MRNATAIFVGVLVLALLGASTSHAQLAIDFESGYSEAALDGQNEWAKWYGSGHNVSSTAGRDGGWGAINPGGYQGDGIAHNLDLSAGNTLTIKGDIYLPEPTGWGGELGFRRADGATDYVVVNFLGGGGYRLQWTDGLDIVEVPLTSQWYTVQVDWTVGGSATGTFKDAGGTLLATLTGDTSGVGDPSTLTHLSIFSSDGVIFDNLSAVSGTAAPIPGDANRDGKVTDADAAILATNWQKSGVGWSEGDFNADGNVTDADAAILATHWQEGVECCAPVPEPATPIALLSMAIVGLFVYAHRKRRCC